MRGTSTLITLLLPVAVVQGQPTTQSALEHLMDAQAAALMNRPPPQPRLHLSVAGGLGDARQGAPLIIRMVIEPPVQQRRVLIAARVGAWTNLIRLDVTNSAGEAVPAHPILTGKPEPRLDLGGGAAECIWVIDATDAARLTPGAYTVVATLDCSSEGMPGFWTGRAVSNPATIRLIAAGESAPPAEILGAELHRLRADLLLGRGEQALARVDTALAATPDQPDLLIARGDILAELRRFAEASHAYDRAADQLTNARPDDVELIARLTSLSGEMRARAPERGKRNGAP